MEQHTLRSVNNCLNTNIYSSLETSGGQSSNLYINVVHFFNTSGLYYKCLTIVIYDRNDSGQYYKTTIVIIIDDLNWWS
jgi:hypothetical protein